MKEKFIKSAYNEISNLDDNKGIIEGYANVYNVKDFHGDISHPNSFTKTVNERKAKIKIYKNHDSNLLIGIPSEMDTHDPHGLKISVKMLMDTQLGRDAYYESKFLTENGFESGFSIGGWIVQRDKANKSIVREYKLNEISLLTKDPANEGSLVSAVKSLDGLDEVTKEEFWRVIEKAYNNNFSDDYLKALENHLELSLKQKEPSNITPNVEPTDLMISIYSQFIK